MGRPIRAYIVAVDLLEGNGRDVSVEMRDLQENQSGTLRLGGFWTGSTRLGHRVYQVATA